MGLLQITILASENYVKCITNGTDFEIRLEFGSIPLHFINDDENNIINASVVSVSVRFDGFQFGSIIESKPFGSIADIDRFIKT